jgi:hypothetical protein
VFVQVRTAVLDHHFDHRWCLFRDVLTRSCAFRIPIDLGKRASADDAAHVAYAWGSSGVSRPLQARRGSRDLSRPHPPLQHVMVRLRRSRASRVAGQSTAGDRERPHRAGPGHSRS